MKEFQRCLKPNGKFIISTFGPQNTFIRNSNKINKNQYIFSGKEKFHNDINLRYQYYIPFNKKILNHFFQNICVLLKWVHGIMFTEVLMVFIMLH